VVLMAVPLIAILSFPLVPMLYALGRAGAPLKARIIASVFFFAALAPLSLRFGVVGAAAAFVIATAANSLIMAVQLSGDYRRLRKA
jgi:O-antigen/teichoic acid export membrane protein